MWVGSEGECNLLHFGSGVSGAFIRKGGPEIQQATIRAAEGRTVTPGDVIITRAGGMQFRYVFHAISSMCRGGTTAEILRRCAVNCLAEARARTVASIAFPALGTGEMGFDMKEAAAVLIDAVVTDCAATPGLDRVAFCLLRPDAFTTFFRHTVRRGIALEANSPSDNKRTGAYGREHGVDDRLPQSLVQRLRSASSAPVRAGLVRDALTRLFVPPLSAPLAPEVVQDQAAYRWDEPHMG